MPTPEDWTPEGTVVVQRYRTLGGAVVLVYNADVGTSYAAACLGCTRRTTKNVARNNMSEEEAADSANAHAGTCRAMPRGVPDRPDDVQATQIVRYRLWRGRKYIADNTTRQVYLTDFHADRVDLQRTRLDHRAADGAR